MNNCRGKKIYNVNHYSDLSQLSHKTIYLIVTYNIVVISDT